MSRGSAGIAETKATIDGERPSQLPGEANPDAMLSPLSREHHKARRDKRNQYFLKGRVTFEWIRNNIPDPASRVVLIARAFMDMRQSDECSLNAKVWDCAGITDRYQRRRILVRLREIGGSYEIKDRKGRPSVLIGRGSWLPGFTTKNRQA